MKTTYILSTFLMLLLSVITLGASVNSPLKLKTDGDLKIVSNNSNESFSASNLDKGISASTKDNFEYLRFDVTKYATPDLGKIDDIDEILLLNDNEFDYLKFNVSIYVNQDSNNLEVTDFIINETDQDYSYLKFDVSKYAGQNMNLSGE